MLTRLVLVILISFCFLSCTNDKLHKVKINPDSIYLDYLAWGDEETGNITLKLQYRAGGPDEPAILLKEPARVEFDGEVLRADSSKFNGPYYEIIRSASGFTGQHRIVFTAVDGKKYTAAFDFPIIYLKTEIPAVVERTDFAIDLEGLKEGDRVRVMLTDTSFYGRGIERIDMPDSNRIFISKRELWKLKNGPVQLEFLREEDRYPGETMEAGGRFYLAYGLKRQFVLQDSAMVK